MVEIRQEELMKLLDAIYNEFGYDFREYSLSHIKRRVGNRMVQSGIGSVADLQKRVLSEKEFSGLFLKDLSIQVTEMFRDPDFYAAMRKTVIPLLRTYSFFKIWHAGSATGEEVYSMAILLKEENLYDRCLIYATDFNQYAVNHGKEGIYSDNKLKNYIKNYQDSGGKASLSDYFTYSYNRIIFNSEIRKNIVWAQHNLVTDGVFAEVNLILCRNVMIYFNRNLQNKVQNLFLNSLANGGVLCLGMKENLQFTDVFPMYQTLDKTNKIYKKKYNFR